MLISWENILLMAALSGVVSLGLLQLYRLWKNELSLAHSLWLALICAVGFVVWFTIFNLFSLSGLDHDLPVPLFPVSPEDMGCAITVGIFVLLYEWLDSFYHKNQQTTSSARRTELIAALIPVLVALVVDVYFI